VAYIIKMPKLGLEMEQGTVLEWYVGPGDDVSEGDTLVEVESEKSIGEVDAREDGTLRQLYVGEQESVPPGTPIGILAAPEADISTLEADVEAELGDGAPEIESSGGEAGSAEATSEAGGDEAGAVDDAGESPAAAAEAVKASPRARERADELDVDLTTVEGTGFDGAITADDVEAATESDDDDGATEAVKASPRARERADELGVDLTTVEGTGFDGAVTADDVEAAAEVAAEAGTRGDGGVRWVGAEDRAVDRYQRVTTVADPAAGEALFETMDAVRAAFEERVTMTDVLLVVVSAALGAQPAMNGTYAEATHQIQETQDVALVGSVDDDAVAGVVSSLAGLSLTEIVERRRSIDGDADAGAGGATFTLANAAETETAGRLINPPAVAALAVDPTSQRATPDGDGVDLQPLVTLALTYDTRALGVDDARAFLDAVCERAERASELVLHSYSGRE
jgi:pyruvate dehydrogenase E2 component (dihydrolipoamide acetyltransferase)